MSAAAAQTIGFNLQSNYITAPTQIPGLQIWLDSSSSNFFSLSNTSNVLQWNDRSANGFNFQTVQGTPTYIGGTSGVFFSAARTDLMRSFASNITYSANVTNVFVVGMFSNPPNGYAYMINFGCNVDASFRYNGGGATNGNDIYNNSSGQILNVNGLSILGTSPPTTVVNNYTVFSCVVGPNAINYSPSVIQLSSASSGRYMNGFINEILFYSNALTITQRQQVEGYLGWKWGLTSQFPQAHPFKVSSNNPGYAADFPQVPQSQITAFTISPRDVAGLSLWLDGADNSTMVLSNTSNITRWTDKVASNAFTLIGSTNPTLTSNVQNGLSAVTFNGTSQSLQNTTFVFPNTAYTVFSLQYLTSTVGQGANYQRVACGNIDWAVFVGANAGLVAVFTGIGTTWNDINALVPNYNNLSNWALVSSYSAPAGTSNTLVNYIYGSNYDIKNGTTTSFTGLTLGGFGAGSQFWNGYVAEFLVYNRVLSDTERQRVESYLSWKWGLNSNLQRTHPYYFNTFLPNVPTQITTTISRFTPTTWLPTAFSGLGLWLDASDSSVQRTGNLVTQWNDKSGLNIIASASNSPTIASNFLNNLNVIQLRSNAQQFFDCGSNTMRIVNQDFAVFALVNISNTQSSAILSKGYTAATTDFYYTLLTTFFQYRSGSSVATASFTLTSNNWFIISGIATRQFGASSTNPTPAYLNGALAGNQNFTSGSSIANNSNFFVGRAETGAYYNGYIAEIIGYSNTITPAQRQQVEGYLAWKWGLTGRLVYGHPNQYIPP